MTQVRVVLCLAAVVAFATSSLPASAQVRTGDPQPTVSLRLASGGAYVGVPFVLVASVEGFDASAAPAQPSLAIAGAKVRSTGMEPSSSRIFLNINGRQTQREEVVFNYTYEVVAEQSGRLEVPSLVFAAGGKRAVSQPARIRVSPVPESQLMTLEGSFPARTIYVGESIPLTYTWTILDRVDPERIEVPMLAMTDKFAVATPELANPDAQLAVSGGARELNVGLQGKRGANGAKSYTFTFLVTPLVAGKVEVPPAFVLARATMGSFGFGAATLERASAQPMSLTVNPLPATGQPSGFTGAVGTSFALEVRASRSVVAVGEPLELELLLKSSSRLDAVRLGPLVGPDALPPELFAADGDAPLGELAPDGLTKTFRVGVTVLGPATQLPAIAFWFFNPQTKAYEQVRSQPIALSVAGADVVDASAVARTSANQRGTKAVSATAVGSLVGADLALSELGSAGEPLYRARWFELLPWLVYAIALGALVGWAAMRELRRRHHGDLRRSDSWREAQALLAKAAQAPAAQVGAALATAIRRTAREVEVDVAASPLLARVETESYAPSAATAPLPPELLRGLEALLAELGQRRVGTSRDVTGSTIGGGALGLVLVGASLLTPRVVVAASDAATSPAVLEARAAYQRALAAPEGQAHQQAFAQAEALFAVAAAQVPSAPVLTDWGNAALGAHRFGVAVLAYRMALARDPGYERARTNLAWIRGQLGTKRAAEASATATLLFFHEWPRPYRLLASAVVFTFGAAWVLWRARRGMRSALWGATPAWVLWLVLVGSWWLDRAPPAQAVVITAAPLRAADAEHAPRALPGDLPEGSELELLSRRGAYWKVKTADGVVGWVTAVSAREVPTT